MDLVYNHRLKNNTFTLQDRMNELFKGQSAADHGTLYPSHTDRHFVYTASCVKTTLAPPTKKLGCQEIETNISSFYEN